MISGQLLGPNYNTNPGLGNQMFCVAGISAHAWKHNDTAIFYEDSSQSIYKHNIFKDINLTTKNFDTTYTHKIEGFCDYMDLPYTPGMYLIGYFQNTRYFGNYSDKIRKLFSPPIKFQYNMKLKYPELNKEVGAIHVRRGDYEQLADYHPPCTEHYYHKAITSVFPEVSHWIVCSDDMEWCKNTFKNFSNITFIEGTKDYEDLWIMSMCDNFIIANSTFSWWSAWLSYNPNKKVVYPSPWVGPKLQEESSNLKELIPDTWISIKNN